MRDGVKTNERVLFGILMGFWTALIVLFAVRSINDSWASRFASLGRRAPIAVLGAMLCWVMYLALRRIADRGMIRRLLVAVGLSIPLGALFSVINAWLIYVTSPVSGETCAGHPCKAVIATNLAVEYSVNFAFVFLAWGAICLGMLASAEAVAAERRESVARDEARIAQLRALHLQVNPHFLFNCLNSLGTLVDRGDATAARAMISKMGGFLRYGLTIDPLMDVDVDDEVEMQRRYLEIEHHRFAHRLDVKIDVSEDVRNARMPPLLLQPLVENAVKHGVSTTSAAVTVSIAAARSADGRVTLVVEDDAPTHSATIDEGSGIGLQNVRDRLRARFDGDATFVAGPRAGGGFRTEISLPDVRR